MTLKIGQDTLLLRFSCAVRQEGIIGKITLVGFLSLFLFNGCMVPYGGQVYVQNDEYLGTKTLRLETYFGRHSLTVSTFGESEAASLSLSRSCSFRTRHIPTPTTRGQQTAGIFTAFTEILSNASSDCDWQYLRCHSLTFLIDGKSFSLETEHDGRVGSSSLSEYVTASIPIETVSNIANASEVRGRLCNNEFSLSSDQIKLFKEFIEKYESLPMLKSDTPTGQHISELQKHRKALIELYKQKKELENF